MERQRKDSGSGGGGGSSSNPPSHLAHPAPGAAGAGRKTTTRQEVKVKHIVTTEVSTDKTSFKDVVQSLTGKDSGAARAAAAAAAGGRTGQQSSNDAVSAGGAARVDTTVAGGLPSTAAEEMRWFWQGA